jgi:RNA polymerase sigma factor (sigma-70 family)
MRSPPPATVSPTSSRAHAESAVVESLSVEVSDAELLARSRAGDQRAGRDLFRRHAPAVLRFFRSKMPKTAEDLTQEVFTRLLAHPPAGPAPMRAYVFGIARNLLREVLKRRHATFDPATTSIADVRLPTSSRLRARRKVLDALLVLPFDLQLTIELAYWEGFTSEELAVALGVSPSAARTRLTVARRRLLQSLTKQFPKRPATDFDDLETWVATMREEGRG